MKLLFLMLLCSSFAAHAGIGNWWKNRQAVQLFHDKKYDESLLIYNELIDKEPFHAEYNYNIGEILYRQSRYQDAQQAFTRAGTHAKTNQKLAEYAFYGAGNCFYQLKEWQNAIDRYQQALKINPDNEQTLHNLRLAQEQLGQEQLKKMQDELEKNKENQDQKKAGDQDSQDKNGDSSQDSSGSSKKDQSSGDKEQENSDQKGSENKDQKGDQKSDGDQKGDQKNLDKKDEKSSQNDADGQQEKGESQGNSSDKSDENQSGAEKSGAEKSGAEKSAKKDIDQKQKDAASEQNLDEQLEQKQQDLDKVSENIAEQEQKIAEEGRDDGEKEPKSELDKTQALKQEDTSLELANGTDSAGAQKGKNEVPPLHKKPELKNELQELYESKSSDDARLDDYYVRIMQALENQENEIQRHVIKNRVATKMAGQNGKKGW